MSSDNAADAQLSVSTAGLDIAEQLAVGELTLKKQIVTGNNAVFIAEVSAADSRGETQEQAQKPVLRCVYKPIAGERPLWDFPDAQLALREVAAYVVDRVLGWGFVPPTVLRDGPLGAGSCQLWIEHCDRPPLVGVLASTQFPADWKAVARGTIVADGEDSGADLEQQVVVGHAADSRLARVAVFDAIINNSDRKAGHLLSDPAGRLWAIDHGISFHPEPKLRTVLWGWAGEPLPDEIVGVLTRLDSQLRGALGTELELYLDADERAALTDRVQQLLRDRRFPQPTPGWPVLPYPLF